MRAIPLSTPGAAGIVAIATAVWCCDFLCLLCSFSAVHAAIPWHGVLLAYGVAQVAGSVPIIPGGIGIVEGSLAVILAAYGAGRVPAFSAALVFRIVSFWLAIAVGWISIGVIALLARRQGRRDAGQAGQDFRSSRHFRLNELPARARARAPAPACRGRAAAISPAQGRKPDSATVLDASRPRDDRPPSSRLRRPTSRSDPLFKQVRATLVVSFGQERFGLRAAGRQKSRARPLGGEDPARDRCHVTRA